MRNINSDPVAMFESELTRIVRRASKSAEYQGPVTEVVSHFGDIFSEELAKCADETTANLRARVRIGSVESIAEQILKTPARTRNGTQIQFASTFVLIASCFIFGIDFFADHFSAQQYVSLLASELNVVAAIFITGGLLFGYGAFLAKRLVWRPAALFLLLFLFLGGLRLNHLFAPATRFKIDAPHPDRVAAIMRDEANRVDGPETHINGMFVRKFADHETPEREMLILSKAIRASNSKFFADSSNRKATYLYPVSFTIQKDPVFSYKLVFGSTDSYKDANQKWQTAGSLKSEFLAAAKDRRDAYSRYWGYSQQETPPESMGFALAFSFIRVATSYFAMFAAFSYLLLRVWVLRLAGLRLRKI